MNITDGGPGEEDPDSMGELLVRKKNVLFEADGKDAVAGLPSPISSKSFVFLPGPFVSDIQSIHELSRSGIYYINAYGNEIRPYPNQDFLTNISLRQLLVYSCGSLWTRSVILERLQRTAD